MCSQLLQCIGNRSLSRFAGNKGRVLHHPEQYDCDAHIKQSADHKRSNDPEGQVTLWSLTFFGCSRHRIEANIGKKDNSPTGHNSGKSRGSKGLPVRRIDEHAAHNQKGQDCTDFDGHHNVVGFGRLAHAADQQQRQDENDQKARKIEVSARPLPRSPYRACPFVRQIDAESGQLRLGVSTKTDRYGNVAYHVFQDQVPADNPGENFPQCRVRICVGAAGDRDHGS